MKSIEDQIRKSAQKALESESKSIDILATNLPQDLPRFILRVIEIKGRVIVSGVGKSGHIGKKIASTLASTGTPSFFIHPTEASHGDLGMIQKEDICLFISNSGEASEFYDILNYIKNAFIQMAAISSNLESTLMKAANFKLTIPKSDEVCPIGLAPTTSAILTLAIGDAIAVSLMEQRNFNKSDYGLFHPGGKLGSQLLRAKDLMHTGEQLPIVEGDNLMEDVLLEMTSKSFGVAVVCKGKKIIGIITDGDLRRHMQNLLRKSAIEIATKNPLSIGPETYAVDALKLMNGNQISTLIVKNEEEIIEGILHIHDLVRVGLV
ncbi:MAG: KpsF/GutQ family sugar-phosphate isomerase [Verrucomicrobiota bacterium]|nr:KpsF/GutQ family sugar-phosphate isomerase [Verrucomicrobiota bacterium]